MCARSFRYFGNSCGRPPPRPAPTTSQPSSLASAPQPTVSPTHSTGPSGLLAGPPSTPGMRAVGTEAIDDAQLALRGGVPPRAASTSSEARAGRNQEQRRPTCADSSRQGSGRARGTHRASFLTVRVKRSGMSSGSAMRARVSRRSRAGARALERCGVATAA